MEGIVIAILSSVAGILLVATVILAIFSFRSRRKGVPDDVALRLVLEQVNELSRTLEKKITESTKLVHDSVHGQLTESAKLIRDVTEGLTKLEERDRQVISFAEQLQNLQEMLKNPKQRGILGEYYLETLLRNVLPPGGYTMQYKFNDGTTVDAVVFIKDKIIPIDSKFSLENYNRLAAERNPAERERLERLFKANLKDRIDETAKYVKQEEGTMDFAFMFIPHEAIYYDLLVAQVGALKVSTRDLIEYAFKEKHVIIVSPTSFLAYLQTVLQGLKALEIEEKAKEIRLRVEELGKHLKAYEEYMLRLGASLSTTVSHYNRAGREFKKVDRDVLRISGTSPGVEVGAIEPPEGQGL